MLRRFAKLAAFPLLLSACVGADNVYAPLDQVASVAWRAPGPPTLTLVTVINNRSGEGAHSALMINGQQRVMFDPAGSWSSSNAPERGDVKYGVTEPILINYIDYHARPEFRVILQEVEVTPELADLAIQAVEAHGPANKATCGRAVSGILRGLGFAEVRGSWFPKRIMADFDRMPGVVTTVLRDDTADEYWGQTNPVIDIDIYSTPF